MKLEWLEDLLAVMETGSLNEASKRRFLTQPAFSRRIQSIERYLGAELFDRERKPLQLKSSVVSNEARIRQITQSLRELATDLKQADVADPVFVLACQHAISTAVAPALVKVLSNNTESRIRLRSANRDECHTLLLTGKSDIVLTYQAQNKTSEPHSEFLESRVMGKDEFVPVISNTMARSAATYIKRQKLDIIRYPDDVFLGQLFEQEILPRIIRNTPKSAANNFKIQWVAETGLTTAALQFALTGIGVAWVPRSLAKEQLATGSLLDLGKVLPGLSIDICALRLKNQSNEATTQVWDWLKSNELPIVE